MAVALAALCVRPAVGFIVPSRPPRLGLPGNGGCLHTRMNARKHWTTPDLTRCRRSCQVCAYLTDVESNLEYFERYVAISKVLGWADSNKTRLKFKRNDAMFVFGGDSQDKGIADIRFVKLMLALKRTSPTA